PGVAALAMLCPAVARCACAALSPVRPILKMLPPMESSLSAVTSYRPPWGATLAGEPQPHHRPGDDARELVRIAGIGRIAGLLQAAGERRRIGALVQYVRIAWVGREQVGVVLERVGIGAVRPEALDRLN